MHIGVDIGGTFTDLVATSDSGGLLNSKSLSTPEDQSIGIMDCLRKADIDLSQAELFLHGCTVAINTVLERKGAKTALVTTRGFRDAATARRAITSISIAPSPSSRVICALK